MAQRDAIRGLSATYSLLDGLPSAAHDEMVVELGSIGRELHAAQEADAPKDTGELASDLTYRVFADRLKLRVGLLGRGNYSRRARRPKRRDFYGEFYAPFVEFGIDAQTVVVTRRIKKRRVAGNGRTSKRQVIYATPKRRLRRKSSPNRGTYVGDPYNIRVKGQTARPFVAQPLLEQVADAHLSEFWANAIARLGAPA